MREREREVERDTEREVERHRERERGRERLPRSERERASDSMKVINLARVQRCIIDTASFQTPPRI